MASLYTEGRILQVSLTTDIGTSRIRVQVLETQDSFTCSCGMFVRIMDQSTTANLPSIAFLKLFDRRFVSGLRRRLDLDEICDSELEYYCTYYVNTGAADAFIGYLRSGVLGSDDGDWSPQQDETFVREELRRLYETELAAYARLQNYQGDYIPKLYGTVRLNSTPPGSQTHELFQVRGLLMQSLDGYTLSTIAANAPPEAWQNIVDQAIHITHVVSDNSILNLDMRPENFMVVPKEEGRYHVFMIDLAMCCVRQPNETDEAREMVKLKQDEEGSVGFPMQEELKQHGFELIFQHSGRFLEFAPASEE